MMQLAGAAMQLAGAGFNAWAGAKAAAKVERLQNAQNRDLKLLNRKEANASILENSANRYQLEQARGAFNNAYNNTAGRNAVTGGSNAAVAAQKASANATMGNIMGQMAAANQARQDSLNAEYSGLVKQGYQNQIDTTNAKRDNMQAAGQAFADMGASMMGGMGKKQV